MDFRRFLHGVVLLSGLFTIPGNCAYAQNAALEARTRVVPAIQLSVSSLNFGDIETTGVYEGQAVITVRVAKGINYRITLDCGRYSAGGSRWMQRRGGPDRLKYELFKDPAATRLWGDSDFEGSYPRGSSLSVTGTGRFQQFTVYGRLYTGNAIPTLGEYIDVVTVSVHY